MYREAAVEVFYPNAYFDFYQYDLRATLSFLRDVVPREALARVQRVNFTMTEAQCEGWGDGALASGYPEHFLNSILAAHCEGSARPPLDLKADWRALLAFLGANTDPTRLSVTVDLGECSWRFVEDPLCFDIYDEAQSIYRFLYDMYIDISTAMCSLHMIGSFEMKLGVFEQLAPWLEREVMGNRYGQIPQPPKRLRPHQKIPEWHRVDERLFGSNYIPDV